MSEKQTESEKRVNALAQVYLKGVIDGMRRYAWWKEGVQYVGTCGTTLEEAIEKVKREFAP